MKHNVRSIITLGACALLWTSLLSSCGVTSEDRGNGLSASISNDVISFTFEDVPSEGDQGARAVSMDILRTVRGFGINLAYITDGFFGYVQIDGGGTGRSALEEDKAAAVSEQLVSYKPMDPMLNLYYSDWFNFEARSANGDFIFAKVVVRFPEIPADAYEPDDEKALARDITGALIPESYYQLADDTGMLPPKTGSLVFTYVEEHTADSQGWRSLTNHDNYFDVVDTSCSISGDEDWFRIDIPQPPDDYTTYLRVAVSLPAGVDSSMHCDPIVSILDGKKLGMDGHLAAHGTVESWAVSRLALAEFGSSPDETSEDLFNGENGCYLNRPVAIWPGTVGQSVHETENKTGIWTTADFINQNPVSGPSPTAVITQYNTPGQYNNKDYYSYYVRINPAFTTKGEYTVSFTIYDTGNGIGAPDVVMPPAPDGIN